MMQRFSTQGSIVIQVIAFMSIGILIVSGFVGWGVMSVRIARHGEQREQVLQIAEAGIDYYRWHLAHAAADFQDGTAAPGPYVHDYFNKYGVKIGTFTLDIIAPAPGSTMVTIKSTGRVLTDPTVARTIQAKFAKPSFAKFALVTNTDVWEDGVEIFGPYHANGGVHFSNVLAHNVVSSAFATYTDPDFGGTHWGVYTDKAIAGWPSGDPAPPTAFPSRPDVFAAGRQTAVPAVDFAGIVTDLAAIKASAVAPNKYGPSGSLGYHIVLKTTDKYDIYTVTAKVTSGSGTCTSNYTQGGDVKGGMWSIQTQVLLAANVDFPANGVIFAEDDVWVDGTIDGARLTIAAARFPDNAATRASIIVNNNLLYTNLDGTDVVGLMAQDYIRVGYASADTLVIDAAILAQSGAIWRDYYRSACGASYVRTKIQTYGSMISNQRYTFSWWCGSFCSGYAAQVSSYDPNLLYNPPPSFPLTTDKYQILSWDEI